MLKVIKGGLSENPPVADKKPQINKQMLLSFAEDVLEIEAQKNKETEKKTPARYRVCDLKDM